MTKHVVEYRLPYDHVVQIGIEADSAEAAEDKAQELFDSGDIWNDTAEVPLLADDYEEIDDGTNVLDFKTIASGDALPQPDDSARQVQSDRLARAAVNALIQAYDKGEVQGGSVDWSDLDEAYRLATESRRAVAPTFDPDASVPIAAHNRTQSSGDMGM